MKIFDFNSFPIPFELGRKHVLLPRGKCCFLVTEDPIIEEIKTHLQVTDKRACLKVFMTPMTDNNIDNYYWGDAPTEEKMQKNIRERYVSKLVDATEIQNILFERGLAPKVYGIVLLTRQEKLYPAQLTEFVASTTKYTPAEVKDRVAEIRKEFRGSKLFLMPHSKLISEDDFIAGKLVDFQGFQKVKCN